jgi:hypothetical protein
MGLSKPPSKGPTTSLYLNLEHLQGNDAVSPAVVWHTQRRTEWEHNHEWRLGKDREGGDSGLYESIFKHYNQIVGLKIEMHVLPWSWWPSQSVKWHIRPVTSEKHNWKWKQTIYLWPGHWSICSYSNEKVSTTTRKRREVMGVGIKFREFQFSELNERDWWASRSSCFTS